MVVDVKELAGFADVAVPLELHVDRVEARRDRRQMQFRGHVIVSAVELETVKAGREFVGVDKPLLADVILAGDEGRPGEARDGHPLIVDRLALLDARAPLDHAEVLIGLAWPAEHRAAAVQRRPVVSTGGVFPDNTVAGEELANRLADAVRELDAQLRHLANPFVPLVLGHRGRGEEALRRRQHLEQVVSAGKVPAGRCERHLDAGLRPAQRLETPLVGGPLALGVLGPFVLPEARLHRPGENRKIFARDRPGIPDVRHRLGIERRQPLAVDVGKRLLQAGCGPIEKLGAVMLAHSRRPLRLSTMSVTLTQPVRSTATVAAGSTMRMSATPFTRSAAAAIAMRV